MDDNLSRQPEMRCWYCGGRLKRDDVLDDGIIRSRDAARGGPYRLFSCPRCHRMNRCEKTLAGRWFASPDIRPHLLDYLIGRLLFANPEDFLEAASWYRENEARRRHFFERDGDLRYSAAGLLDWLRTARIGAPAAPSGHAGERTQRTGEAGARDEPPPHRERPRRERPRIVSPWEILGVEESSSDDEIRRAFHRLAVQYHPDKVHHLGEEFQRIATEKFKELQRAYESMRRRRASGEA